LALAVLALLHQMEMLEVELVLFWVHLLPQLGAVALVVGKELVDYLAALVAVEVQQILVEQEALALELLVKVLREQMVRVVAFLAAMVLVVEVAVLVRQVAHKMVVMEQVHTVHGEPQLAQVRTSVEPVITLVVALLLMTVAAVLEQQVTVVVVQQVPLELQTQVVVVVVTVLVVSLVVQVALVLLSFVTLAAQEALVEPLFHLVATHTTPSPLVAHSPVKRKRT
jgi:hypothetical protein